MNLRAWALAARPKTLSAAAAPVIIGTALAYRDRDGQISWTHALLALTGAALIQIATNFINDALDFKKGADTAERLGPTRMTQAGLLGADAVMRGAFICLTLAALCGIPLMYRGGWPLFAIGVASIAAAYIYTGGPFPLAYHGLGELFVLLFFGVVAVGGTYYVLVLRYWWIVFAAGVAVGSLAVVILAINNLRDIDGDRAVNKRTVAVRLGPRGGRADVVFFTLLPYLMCSAMGPLIPMVTLPLAVALLLRVSRSAGARLNSCLAMAGVLQWAFAIAFAIDVVLRGINRRW